MRTLSSDGKRRPFQVSDRDLKERFLRGMVYGQIDPYGVDLNVSDYSGTRKIKQAHILCHFLVGQSISVLSVQQSCVVVARVLFHAFKKRRVRLVDYGDIVCDRPGLVV